MDPKGRASVSLEEALDRILGSLPGTEVEEVPLEEALGRILCAEVRCAEDFPSADVSAMDGFAVRSADLARTDSLELAGESLAGSPPPGALPEGTCRRTMTGGLIPGGADAVVPVEQTTGFEPGEGGRVGFRVKPEPGAHIRPRGSVKAEGEPLLSPGTLIRPATVGILAQQGMLRVPLGRRPRVAVLPTGDEVVELGEKPGPGQVRNSNAHALVAQVRAAGGLADLQPILRDREAQTRDRLLEALEGHDLVCTIGGVSMGTRDLIRGAFAELGGKALVQAIRIKPGKPTLFGTWEKGGKRSALLGLPGNPASAFTIFALCGAAWIRGFQGMPLPRVRARRRALLWFSKVRPHPRLQVLPARLRLAPEGVTALNLPQRTSADLFSLAEADLLFLVGENRGPRDGEIVEWVELP